MVYQKLEIIAGFVVDHAELQKIVGKTLDVDEYDEEYAFKKLKCKNVYHFNKSIRTVSCDKIKLTNTMQIIDLNYIKSFFMLLNS